MSERKTAIRAAFAHIAENFTQLAGQADAVDAAAGLLLTAIHGGHQVLFCGNGGSAADSQHLAAELMGRYRKERRPLPALALTVDTSALTAIGNDYGFAEVFVRQVRGVGRPGDVLVGLSTSGNSENVIKALAAAREMGLRTVGLTGAGGGRMGEVCDVCIRVPATETNHIQEMHIAVGHLLCGFVEDSL